jgi:ribonuclease VapC
VIVVDTSALISIYENEPDGPVFRIAVNRAVRAVVPASSYLEFVLASERQAAPRAWLDRLLGSGMFSLERISVAAAVVAADAAIRYGRGSGHKARLNFGDCLSYAVAKHLNAPLLFKGEDFSHTDIESALAS